MKNKLQLLAVAVLAVSILSPLAALAHEPGELVAPKADPTVQASVTRVAEINKLASKAADPALAQERQALLLDLARKNPAAFLGLTLPSDKQATIAGKLTILHVDDFSHPENSRFDYFVMSGAKRYELHSLTPITLAAGTPISVSGFVIDNVMVTKGTDNVKATGKAAALDSVGSQRTAILLVDFLDSGPRPFTPAAIKDYIFLGQFQNFYREQSFNQVSFTGNVFGWFTLPRNAPSNNNVCGAVTTDDIGDIIVANDIDLGNYDRLVVIPSHPYLNGGCSSVGKSDWTFGGSTYNISASWIGNAVSYNEPSWWGSQPFSWSNMDFVMAHELGHALGVMHANGWDCGSKVMYGDNCSHIEYGNYFDTMGTVGYSLHFNALYKEMLGWLHPSDIVTASSSMQATLHPLEMGSGAKLLKVQMQNSTSTPYYIEYRQGLGFDSNLNSRDLMSNQRGVFVNKRIDTWSSFPRLLDMTPTTASWYDDIRNTTLNPGKEFADPGRGLKIKMDRSSSTISASSTAVVQVTFGMSQCLRQAPLLQNLYSSDYQIPAGSYAYTQVILTNQDYYACGPSKFSATVAVPKPLVLDWSYFVQEALAPEESAYNQALIFVPEDTSTGSYVVTYTFRNTAGGLSRSIDIPLYICSLEDCPK